MGRGQNIENLVKEQLLILCPTSVNLVIYLLTYLLGSPSGLCHGSSQLSLSILLPALFIPMFASFIRGFRFYLSNNKFRCIQLFYYMWLGLESLRNLDSIGCVAYSSTAIVHPHTQLAKKFLLLRTTCYLARKSVRLRQIYALPRQIYMQVVKFLKREHIHLTINEKDLHLTGLCFTQYVL